LKLKLKDDKDCKGGKDEPDEKKFPLLVLYLKIGQKFLFTTHQTSF